MIEPLISKPQSIDNLQSEIFNPQPQRLVVLCISIATMHWDGTDLQVCDEHEIWLRIADP